MKIKATKKSLTIVCGPAEAYLVERALMHYGDSMVGSSTLLACQLCDAAYAIQREMLRSGMERAAKFTPAKWRSHKLRHHNRLHGRSRRRMAMQKQTRRELNKLRELLWYFVRGKHCYFCHEPLSAPEKMIRDGDGTAEPFNALDITIHHLDGNHARKDAANEALAHFSCHKSHHAKHMVRKGGKFHKQGKAVIVDVRIARRKAA